MGARKSLITTILLLTAVVFGSKAARQSALGNGGSPLDAAIDSPARQLPRVDDSRAQRKPAVEPRVYIEDASSKSGWVYYDYADQAAPTVPQRPPSE